MGLNIPNAEGLGSAAPKQAEDTETKPISLPETKTDSAMTASELEPAKVDAGSQVEAQNKVVEESTNQAAARAGVTNETEGKVYTSHPVQNFSLGRFRFEKAILTLADEDVEEFETLLAAIPAPDRQYIKELNKGAADAIAKAHINSATRDFDSSVGREALQRMQAATPVIGTKELGDDAALGHAALDGGLGTGNADVIIEQPE